MEHHSASPDGADGADGAGEGGVVLVMIDTVCTGEERVWLCCRGIVGQESQRGCMPSSSSKMSTSKIGTCLYTTSTTY